MLIRVGTPGRGEPVKEKVKCYDVQGWCTVRNTRAKILRQVLRFFLMREKEINTFYIVFLTPPR